MKSIFDTHILSGTQYGEADKSFEEEIDYEKNNSK